MKEPIEYLGNVNSFTTREELYNIGKQMQIEAYNEAINDALENVEIDYTHSEQYKNRIYFVDNSSILKLLKS